MKAAPTSDPATTLCTSCGLCCDGSLHSHVTLRHKEIEPGRALGLPILTEGRSGFSTPCPKLIDRCCTIYAVRPSACRGYKCQLLYDLEDGRINLPAALSIVAEALKLGAAVARDGPAREPVDRIEAAHRTLRLTAFRHFLDRHFRNKYEGPMTDQQIVSDGREATPS